MFRFLAISAVFVFAPITYAQPPLEIEPNATAYRLTVIDETGQNIQLRFIGYQGGANFWPTCTQTAAPLRTSILASTSFAFGTDQPGEGKRHKYNTPTFRHSFNHRCSTRHDSDFLGDRKSNLK